MSGILDDKVLLLLCLLIRRRRRRLRQNVLRANQEPAISRRQIVVQKNQRPLSGQSLVNKPLAVHQHNEVQANQERFALHQQNKVTETVELLAFGQQSKVPKNPEPLALCQEYVAGENQIEQVASKGTGRARSNRKWWVHPSLASMSARSDWKIFHNSLKEDPEKFRQHYQLPVNCFYDVLGRIEKSITGTDTPMREAVEPETKLAATLRHLAQGGTYRLISDEFHLGRSTVSLIVRGVCNAIWEALRSPHIGEPTVEEMLKISEDYERKTGFPHCLGALGGRYLHVKQKGSGNDLFIFRNSYAVAFVALVDSNFKFRFVDVSGYRQENDLFKATSLGSQVFSRSLSLPQPHTLPNFPESLPYVFVSNDFALSQYVLRPFNPRTCTPEKEVFNSMLEKAVAPFDSALKMLTSRWAILQRSFEMAGEGTEAVLKACCVLHNYLGDHEGFPPVEDLPPCTFDHLVTDAKAGGSAGSQVRTLFTNYFNSQV